MHQPFIPFVYGVSPREIVFIWAYIIYSKALISLNLNLVKLMQILFNTHKRKITF